MDVVKCLKDDKGSVPAIDVLFSDHPECLDLIFIYLSGLMIAIGNLRLLKQASVEDKEVHSIIKD